jgi:solute carrier family 13 (sodium-dependent dicarboxylate transporter), member 2/3/5
MKYRTRPGNNYLLVALALVVFIVLLNTLPFEHSVVVGLSILVLTALLWLTEAIHITVTALLIPVLAIGFHVFDTTTALSHFSNPILYQFLGGFALACALQKQGLDKAIANKVIALAKGRLSIALLMLLLVTGALSMWISNTATTAMMLPLILGLLNNVTTKNTHKTYLFALLGIAYCASIGGMATIIGTAPNAIAAAETGLNFIEWMRYGVPAALLLLPTTIALLYIVLKPDLSHQFTQKQTPLCWDRYKSMTLGIFALIVTLWIFSLPINRVLGELGHFDAVVGLLAIILLCTTRVVTWKNIEQSTDWGILLLLGGGLCLGSVLKETNTSTFLAHQLSATLLNTHPYLMLISISTFVVILTEFASNTASAALLIPVFTTVSQALGLPPILISVLIALSASCAFMLPAATPPNAIVFGSGHILQKDMIKMGRWINIASVIALSAFAYFGWQ